MSDSRYFFFWMPSISRLKVGTLAINYQQAIEYQSFIMLPVSPESPELAPPNVLLWLLRVLRVSNAWAMTSLMLRIDAAIELRSRSSFATAESWSSPRLSFDELNNSMLSLFRWTVVCVQLHNEPNYYYEGIPKCFWTQRDSHSGFLRNVWLSLLADVCWVIEYCSEYCCAYVQYKNWAQLSLSLC